MVSRVSNLSDIAYQAYRTSLGPQAPTVFAGDPQFIRGNVISLVASLARIFYCGMEISS